jgi:hypothetical protein
VLLDRDAIVNRHWRAERGARRTATRACPYLRAM